MLLVLLLFYVQAEIFVYVLHLLQISATMDWVNPKLDPFCPIAKQLKTSLEKWPTPQYEAKLARFQKLQELAKALLQSKKQRYKAGIDACGKKPFDTMIKEAAHISARDIIVSKEAEASKKAIDKFKSLPSTKMMSNRQPQS